MRIAIASSGLGNVRRGMEGWSLDLSLLLHRKGIQVTLFKGAGEPNHPFEKVLPTFKRNSRSARFIGKATQVGGWRVGLGSSAAVETFFFGLQLVRQLRKQHFDLIHLKQGSLAQLLKRAKNIGLHSVPIVLSNGQIANRPFLSQFDYVQHLTPCLEDIECREIAESELPTNRFVIPNFINLNQFSINDKDKCRQKLNLPQNAQIILTVGTIKKYHKRMDYFINEMAALKRISKIPLHFVIAGAEDSETPDILRFAKEKLGKDLTVLVNVAREEMPIVYGAADVFVLCSLVEAFGTAIIEAMASGLLVITHNYPSFSWITEGVGEHLDLTENQALAKSLLKHLPTGSNPTPSLKTGRDIVVRNFSEEAVAAKMIAMYEQIIGMENERLSKVSF